MVCIWLWLQYLGWSFPAPFRALKITVKAYDGQVVFLSSHILVGIVKIEVKLFYHGSDPLCVLGLEVNQRNSSIHKSILNETQQRLHPIQFAHYHPDRMKSEIGYKETL